MDKGARLRWIILVALAGATAVLSFYPNEDNSSMVEKHARKPVAVSASSVPETQAASSDEELDPFAPRGWKPPPPPPPPAPVVPVPVAAVPAAPPVPAGPPPLPFKFMGAMNDDGNQVVYLSRGDQALVANKGETLDGTYKVVDMDAQHIEFEYLPSGEKQTLTIPASDN